MQRFTGVSQFLTDLLDAAGNETAVRLALCAFHTWLTLLTYSGKILSRQPSNKFLMNCCWCLNQTTLL